MDSDVAEVTGRAGRWLAALAAAAQLAGCGTVVREVRKDATGMVSPPPRDLAMAQAAWAYFESPGGAFESADGVREAVKGGGFTTPAALGDQLAATIAAYRTGLVDRAAFDSRIARILRFLDDASLSGVGLPGRFYDIRTGRLMDPSAQGANQGADPGWSSIEIGRLLVWLRILAQEQPRLAVLIGQIVARWNLCQAIDADGRPLGAVRAGGQLVGTVETGTGYGEYALQGFRAWGVAAPVRATPEPRSSMAIEGLAMPLPDGARAEPMMTAPYALLGMEFGWVGVDGAPMTMARRGPGARGAAAAVRPQPHAHRPQRLRQERRSLCGGGKRHVRRLSVDHRGRRRPSACGSGARFHARGLRVLGAPSAGRLRGTARQGRHALAAARGHDGRPL
jgi:hypothetical protein